MTSQRRTVQTVSGVHVHRGKKNSVSHSISNCLVIWAEEDKDEDGLLICLNAKRDLLSPTLTLIIIIMRKGLGVLMFLFKGITQKECQDLFRAHFGQWIKGKER
jgi:hypothetical protein